MVYYIEEGDIFNIDNINNYAHGCNCSGAMGKGIALAFREKYPQMYKKYKEMCEAGKFTPGNVFDYQFEKTHIYTLATQVSWRTNAEIEYIRLSIKHMLELANSSHVRDIAMPAIGSGLGGLEWKDVKIIIDKTSSDFPFINLYVIERYKPIKITECFIEKLWEEENITFCIHFIGEEAVRQIEIAKDCIKCISQSSPFLYDQKLSDLELNKEDYISKEKFEMIWKKGFLGD